MLYICKWTKGLFAPLFPRYKHILDSSVLLQMLKLHAAQKRKKQKLAVDAGCYLSKIEKTLKSLLDLPLNTHVRLLDVWSVCRLVGLS